jgi:hypothetical protein
VVLSAALRFGFREGRESWVVDGRSPSEATRRMAVEEQAKARARGHFGSSREKEATLDLAGQLLIGYSIGKVIRSEAILPQIG